VEREAQQVIPALRRGRKLQKAGGGSFRPFATATAGPPSDDTRPHSSKYPKGSYLTPPRLVEDRRPCLEERPLTKAAEKLLAEYYKRLSFVGACEDGASVEWAGRHLLGVKKVRAYEIRTEIEECGGVWGWFHASVLQMMDDGRIGRGRGTKKSRVADAFFVALAGGEPGLTYLRAQCGCADKMELERIAEQQGGAQGEALDYLVHSHLLWGFEE
jgi:hypothetical protein